MSTTKAIRLLNNATDRCEKAPNFARGLLVCQASREVWDVFEGLALIAPGDAKISGAPEAALALSRGLSVMARIPVPSDASEGSKLKRFIKSVTERRDDIHALATGGVDAFRQRTLESAMSDSGDCLARANASSMELVPAS